MPLLNPNLSALSRIAVVALLAGSLPASTISQPTAPADETALRTLEQQWNDAIVRKDTVCLQRLLAPDFIYIDPAGTLRRKADVLRACGHPAGTVEPFTTEDVEVRVYQRATAVLTGTFAQRGTWQGQPLQARFRYTDVYVRRGGRWMPVTAHASRLPLVKK